MKKLYESIMKEISKSIKNTLLESKFDDIDHSNNNSFKFIKKRIINYYKKSGYYATIISPNRQLLDQTLVEIKIRKGSEYIGLNVVYRKRTSSDNFCLKIQDKGINLFNDENVTHIAFVFDDDYYGDKHEIYILDKDIIKDVYNNLIENKKIKYDEYKNFLWRQSLCLSNKFITENKIDNFTLNPKLL